MELSVGDLVVSVEAAACGVGSGANIVLYSSCDAKLCHGDAYRFGRFWQGQEKKSGRTSAPDAKITNSTCHPSLGVA